MRWSCYCVYVSLCSKLLNVVIVLQLLSVSPCSNALSLVYRDEDSLCFTKYINHRAVLRNNIPNSSSCDIAVFIHSPCHTEKFELNSTCVRPYFYKFGTKTIIMLKLHPIIFSKFSTFELHSHSTPVYNILMYNIMCDDLWQKSTIWKRISNN